MNRFLLIIFLFSLTPFLTSQQLDLRLAGAEARTYGPGMQPVLAQYGERAGLMFSATFLTDSPRLVVWDLPVKEDLSHCAGIKLRFYCHKPTIVGSYRIFLKTGDCWQVASFTPQDSKLWQEVFLPKTRFQPVTRPASWQQVSMMRLELTKAATGRTVMHLASVEFKRPNVPAALLRSGSTKATCRLSYHYSDMLYRSLEAAGILPAVIEQDDTTYLNLRPYQFLFLPLPSAVSPLQLSHVLSFLRRGGKAAVFHNLPPMLQQQMKLPAGRFMVAENLGLKLNGVRMAGNDLPGASSFRQNSEAFMATGRLLPPLSVLAYWEQSDGESTQFPAIIQTPAGFWMTHVYLGEDPAGSGDTFAAMLAKVLPNVRSVAAYQCYERARQTFNDSPLTPTEKGEARELLQTAREMYDSQQFGATVEMTRNAMAALKQADRRPVPPRYNEIRAVWADLSANLPGATWKQTVKVLSDSDINAVVTPVATPMVANFYSKTTPLINSRTALKEAAGICRANGIQVHGWLNCLSLEAATVSQVQQHWLNQLKQQHRLQVTPEGKTLFWLCPSQIANRKQVVRLAAEMATELDLDGIQLDSIRYPSSQGCFCPACRKAFSLYLGRETNWPQDVLPGGTDRKQWLAFREQIISSLVAEITAAVRQARPSLTVSAAVYPDLAVARENVGQNWHNWLDYHYLHLVSPLNYYASDIHFRALLEKQVRETGLAGSLVPSIGLSVHELSLEEAQRQVQTTRQVRAGGFLLYKLGLREAQDIIPYIIQR